MGGVRKEMEEDLGKRWRGIQKRDGGGFRKEIEGDLEKRWRGI